MSIVKQGDKDYLEEHSKKKIEFYRFYLEEYLTVLLHTDSFKSINIYDPFCGIGIYEKDSGKGSPVEAAEAIRKILSRYPEKKKPISLLINDIDSQKVLNAEKYIRENFSGELFDLESHSKDAVEILEDISRKIAKSDRKSAHLLFIDPHGYKNIYRDTIVNILRGGKSEILLFLPVSQMYRFIKPSEEDRTNPSYEPLRRFMEEFSIATDAQSPLEYIEAIREALVFSELDKDIFTTNFILQSDRKNYYALFFVTQHIKGLEKALEAKWKTDEEKGLGYMQKMDMGLFNGEYSDREINDHHLSFADSLYEYLKEERSNAEIYRFTLERGFLPKHALKHLREWEKEKKLLISPDRQKGAFYINYKNYKESKCKVRRYEQE